MDEGEVVEALLEHARDNDVHDVVVLDVPKRLLEEAGAEYSERPDEHGVKVASTLVAGPVEFEGEDGIALDSPSRVGSRDDFSPEVRKQLRAEGVYGFRDGYLDGVEFPRDEVELFRP